MKKILTLALFGSLMVTTKSFAQSTNLNLSELSSLCNNQKKLHLNYDIATNDSIDGPTQITVDWGDGTVEIFNTGEFNISFFNYPNDSYNYSSIFHHTYNIYAVYNVNASIVSGVTGQIITASPVNITHAYGANCGRIDPYTIQISSCNSGGNYLLQHAVYDLIGNDNTITTFNNYIATVNPNNAPYTLKMNDTWLQSNNLTQITPDVIITGFDINFLPILPTSNTGLYPVFEVETMVTSNGIDLSFNHSGSILGYSCGILPLQIAYCQFMIINPTCYQNPNVKIRIDYPSFLTPITTGLTNEVISGNSLTYDKILTGNYNWEAVDFFLPGTTPIDSELNFTITLTDLHGIETILDNNTLNLSGIIFNSYDPNDKLVNKPFNINPAIADELQYIINFQNEGNYAAVNVEVIDTLSENLDLSTFKVLSNKHSVQTSLDPNTRIVKFKFNNIYLSPKATNEEASKGQIMYSIKEKENLPIDAEIKNTAYIYFDFNEAIITNTTINKNAVLGIRETQKSSFNVYPNPASETFRVKGENIESITILDASGKIVLSIPEFKSESISVSELKNGIYFVRIQSNDSIVTEKIIVRK